MRSVLSALVALATLALPVVAHATTIDDFHLSGYGVDVTFKLPSSPVPSSVYPDFYFAVSDLLIEVNRAPTMVSSAYFSTAPNGGGFTFTDPSGAIIDDLDLLGGQLFTGTVSKPIFKIGSFDLTPANCEASVDAAVVDQEASPCSDRLTISSPMTATPEPGSLALLGTGALGITAVLRRRLA